MGPAWFSGGPEGRIVCELCPHHCSLGDGAFGLCKVRGNSGGSPILPFAGRPSSIADDPIEKKPLYRFLPGSRVFSVGFFGCNMRCPFCQNWEISQRTVKNVPYVAPADLIDAALKSGSPSVAFTYSEPTVHFEYVLESSRLARKAGLRAILVTNGLLNAGPAAELLEEIDAVNLDIKCFSPSVYAKVLGGDLEVVLDFARTAVRSSWLEVTTLVVPGLDEWEGAIARISSFLGELSPHIPLHLSAYHPAWKHDASPTSPGLLERLREIASSRLESVYVGNVGGKSAVDRCHSCGAALVERSGYGIVKKNLARNEDFTPPSSTHAGARCAVCGHPEFFIID